MITIDYRESKMIEYSKKTPTFKLKFEVETLAVGDIRLECNGSIVLIERKTLPDLWSSISSNRYDDQRQRLLDTGAIVVYIIEGDLKTIPEKYYKMTHGMIMNNQIYYNIKVLVGVSVKTTWYYIESLYKKMPFNVNNAAQILKSPLSKSDLVHGNFSNHQLMLIKGVSFNTTKVILEVHGSFTDLIKVYLKLDRTDGEQLLKDIKISDSRKLGAVLSKRIYTSLFPEP